MLKLSLFKVELLNRFKPRTGCAKKDNPGSDQQSNSDCVPSTLRISCQSARQETASLWVVCRGQGVKPVRLKLRERRFLDT
ncbi:hypothetical protein EYF80_011139 [Liparis tanakae]|uniref:Uncharacterized protein n=1 Tax=Liparis tanakae TaxID=230148 RepID=A0A4Z2IM50_9TELE|nr:hypothetical protein EYF80_011139 [Liparis tanakae]